MDCFLFPVSYHLKKLLIFNIDPSSIIWLVSFQILSLSALYTILKHWYIQLFKTDVVRAQNSGRGVFTIKLHIKN